MASRMVEKESAKCRSGRERDRTRGTLPSSRGGEMPQALSEDEGVAAEGDRDVMIPAWEGASLEVVEPELALHLGVDVLGAIALLEDAHDLLLAHRATEGGQRELARRLLAMGPLGDEPERLARSRVGAVVVSDLDAAEGEARAQLAAGTWERAFTPGDAAEGLGAELLSDGLRRTRGSAAAI